MITRWQKVTLHKYKIVISTHKVASKLYTLVEKGAYKGGKIPMQELDSQRGEGAYFWGNTVILLLNIVSIVLG